MSNIKISVVIPVYNVEKYVRKCVESIMNQTFKEIEIICVNDGSPDNSLKILEELQKKDNRIIIINQENKGLCSARNIGLQKATGDYIIFIDSDDWLELTCLEECYNKITKLNLDMVTFGVIKNYSENLPNEFEKDLREFDDDSIISGREHFISHFKGNATQAPWNKLIRRDILIKNNIKFFEGIFLNEDFCFLAIITKYLKKIGKIDKYFYNYRIGNNNGSGKVIEKNILDLLVGFSKIENLYLKDKFFFSLLKKRKILTFGGIILNKKYHKFKSYKKFEKEFFINLKQITFDDEKIININKKNLILLKIFKLFPFHLTVCSYIFIRDFKHRNN